MKPRLCCLTHLRNSTIESVAARWPWYIFTYLSFILFSVAEEDNDTRAHRVARQDYYDGYDYGKWFALFPNYSHVCHYVEIAALRSLVFLISNKREWDLPQYGKFKCIIVPYSNLESNKLSNQFGLIARFPSCLKVSSYKKELMIYQVSCCLKSQVVSIRKLSQSTSCPEELIKIEK